MMFLIKNKLLEIVEIGKRVFENNCNVLVRIKERRGI